MFTIKLYDGSKSRIYEAAYFTINRELEGSDSYHGYEWAEITAHGIPGHDDLRFDIGPSPYEPAGGNWKKAYIENSSGRTTETLDYTSWPNRQPRPLPIGGVQPPCGGRIGSELS